MANETPFHPLTQLTPEDGHVLIVAASGCIETPLRATIGLRAANGEILSLDHRPLGEIGLPVIGYMPLPWSEAQAEDLIIAYGTASDDCDCTAQDRPIDAVDLAYRSRGIVFELSEAIGPKRAMEHLATLLGLTGEEFVLPDDTPDEIHALARLTSEWMGEEISPENAIAAAGRILDGSAPAEEIDQPEDGAGA